MTKKIGILTLPPVSNYGGILQNYALQRVLTEKGYEVITLERRHRPSKLYNIIYYIKNIIYDRFVRRSRFKKFMIDEDYAYREQKSFKDKYIKSSKLLYSSKELNKFVKEYRLDALIVGSDQVWRAEYTPFLRDMFFCFLDGNISLIKLSYAASFGKDSINYSEHDLIEIRKSIKSFDLVTVREDSGIELCMNELGVNAKHVLDPTMLISKNDYIRNLDLVQRSADELNGIYFYFLDNNEVKERLLELLKQRINTESFCCQPNAFLGDFSLNQDDFYCPPIEKWLQGFCDSKFVVTDSFHGTVFAIIFEKPFFTVVNKEKGASRFMSLLGQLGLKDRLLENESFSDSDFAKLNFEVDFKKVNLRLRELRITSEALLFEALGKM